MADFYSRETTGALDGTLNPPKKMDGRLMGAKTRKMFATFDLASQASGSFLVIGRRPAGSRFMGYRLTTDTSLGSANVSVGTRTSAARDGAAAALTATNTPTSGAKVSALAADAIAADEIVGLTTSAAALPASGILIVEYFYTTNN